MRKEKQSFYRNLLALLFLAAVSGCASQEISREEERILAGKGVAAAANQLNLGRQQEANLFIQAVLEFDPGNEAARSMEKQLQGKNLPSDSYEPGQLGVNKARTIPYEHTRLQRILWYIPDRILDLADIFSGDIHAGEAVGINLHATRAVQAGADTGITLGMGWYQKRNLALQLRSEASLNVVCTGASSLIVGRVGWIDSKFGKSLFVGDFGPLPMDDDDDIYSWRDEEPRFFLDDICSPESILYQDYLDYWAVGGSVTFIVGASADIHPLEIADFLCGFVGVDICRDDVARNRRYDLSSAERQLLYELRCIRLMDE